MLGHILQIDIGEIHIIELHAAQLLQLFLHAPPHLQRHLQNLLQLLLGIHAIRIHQFHQTAHHLPDCDGISLIQVLAQTEIFIQRITKLLLPKLPQKLRQIVCNETIIIGKMLRPELRDLPARNITMHTVQKCRICPHLGRKRIKQAGSLQQHFHTLVNVAHKDHGGRSRLFFLASGKGPGGHIVLHDLDAIFILKVNAGNLIKGDAIPHTDKPHGLPAHVVEQIGHRGLSAGYQNTVGRNLLIQMRFTRRPRSQLTQVKVILHQRNHTKKQKPLLPPCQLIRLHTDGPHHNIQPFPFGEILPPFLQLLNINMRHLDRRQLHNLDG